MSKCRLAVVPSLMSLSLDYIVANLSKLSDKDFKHLTQLPRHIKNRMLRKFTSCSALWEDVDFKATLKSFANSNTQHLDLTSRVVDDDTLKILQGCGNLRELYLTRVQENLITSQGLLDLIPHLGRIHLLRISNCAAVNDDVIRSIATNCPRLAGLDVGGCSNVTDESLIALSQLRNLTWLTFSNTQVSDLGIDILVKGPSGVNIKELRTANCSNVTENVLKSISANCPNMEILVFQNIGKGRHSNYFDLCDGSMKKLKQLNWTIEW